VEALNKQFLKFVFLTPEFQSGIKANIHGGVNQNVHAEDIKDQFIALPSLLEQIAIATFLDRETAKIDALVEEQRRLIELLKEKRQAIISHAITKGLDPSAPMKSSGVEWLGDVPAHWEVCALGRVTLDKCDGPFGSGIKSEHYTEEGVRVIRLQNIRRDGFDGSDAAFIDELYYRNVLGGHDVRAGDVLIAGLGDDRNTVGRACVAPVGIEPAMVKADCFRFRLDTSRALPSFIATQLTAGASYDAGVLSTGSTRSRIPLSVTATRKIANPPVSEQREIMQWLEAQTRRFDLLATEAEIATALLQERRAALISAAVTGKIDVRGLVETEMPLADVIAA
jgi:type I restriction enzyme S subunit